MITPKGYVLITGAAKRIGRTIALELASAGWNIALHFHTSRTEAHETAQKIRAMGREVHLVNVDLENREAVRDMISNIKAAASPLTALVNNASLFDRDENDPTGMRHRVVNFEAPIMLCEQLLGHLPHGRVGSVVNLLEGTEVSLRLSGYAASKRELHAVTLSLARSMAPRVRVNAVALGATLINERQSKEHFDDLISSTPLRVPSSPQLVATTIRFLLENPAITGEVIHVDGGKHLLTSHIPT